eukprot:1189742-Prorocentrum_minimum.AAC.2
MEILPPQGRGACHGCKRGVKGARPWGRELIASHWLTEDVESDVQSQCDRGWEEVNWPYRAWAGVYRYYPCTALPPQGREHYKGYKTP